MELALYCPLCGYYEKKRDTTGPRGDFYTSVNVGSLFGELLAFQFAEWLKELQIAGSDKARAGCGLQIVEAGAHDGRLAKDILTWLLRRRPVLVEKVKYWIIEPSAPRQEWQCETLDEWSSHVRWSADFGSLPQDSTGPVTNPPSAISTRQSVCGVIFSNELLDAMPVHRLGWDAKRRGWFEWGVSLNADRFVWTRLPDVLHPSTLFLPASEELLDVLPDGFTAEACPAAEDWWRAAAGALKQGKLMTLDYGLSADEFFASQRTNGTLRAYHRHGLADDVLAHPGEQDLTAHVNFTALERAGEAAGLKTEKRLSQAQFLMSIAQRAWQAESGSGPWTREHTRQFQTLTHPQHLGRAFQVLLQSRAGL
jgi:SAM-dependent MidA family methyltransferase